MTQGLPRRAALTECCTEVIARALQHVLTMVHCCDLHLRIHVRNVQAAPPAQRPLQHVRHHDTGAELRPAQARQIRPLQHGTLSMQPV